MISPPSSLYYYVIVKRTKKKKDTDSKRRFAHAYSLYSLKLKTQIETIQNNDLKEMKTKVDLGSNFYVQAKM
jgi:hypothetical protein